MILARTSLSWEHEDELVLAIIERLGIAATKAAFADACLILLEDVAGFEGMTLTRTRQTVNYFWSKYMAKAAAAKSKESTPTNTATPEVAAPPDLTTPSRKVAIEAGKKVIEEGGSKADAARAIYEKLAHEGKDIIVAAFVEGAALTPKGALTYWYNCKRKASKKA